MPENWKTYKLGEVTTKIGSGATPRGGKEAYMNSGISLIRSQNVLDFSFSTDGLAFIDDAQANALNNVTIESRDVLLNITGDSVARVCQVPDKWIPARVNQHVAIIRANQDVLIPEFLLYSLLTKGNKNTLLTLASAGATRNALTKTMIEDFEITIPPLPEQTAIASILSAIDDKIENNLQMNKTLEEMAMTLYKHWFVDFEFPYSPPNSPPLEGCPQGGVVVYHTPNPQGGVVVYHTPNPQGGVVVDPANLQPSGVVVSHTPNPQGDVIPAPATSQSCDVIPAPAPHPPSGILTDSSHNLLAEEPAQNFRHRKRNTQNYISLPYNADLKQRAAELRKAGNLAEVLFWLAVKNGQFKGFDFDRQKIIGNYIVDFYCTNANVVIEIDGSSHDDKQEYDARRDAYLRSLGLTVLHISDTDVKFNLDLVLQQLLNHPAFRLDAVDGNHEDIPGLVEEGEYAGWRKDGEESALRDLGFDSDHDGLRDLGFDSDHDGLRDWSFDSDHDALRDWSFDSDHPALRAPLQRRGIEGEMGYKSGGGEFVDSELGRIPKGWEVKRLEEFVELVMGQSPKSEFYNDNQEGLPFHQGVSDYGIRFPNDSTYSTVGNREAKVGDILFSVRAPVGRLNIAKNRIILGRGLASMSMKGNNSFLFYALKRMFATEDIIGSGTVFNSVNKTELQNLEFVVPNENVLRIFRQIIDPIDEQYFINYSENQTLTTLRDTLLPKLISGEVRLKEFAQT